VGLRRPRHDKELARHGWDTAAGLIAAGQHRLVILDELTYLCTWGWIDTAAVAAAIRDRPEQVNVIVTGRDAPPELIDLADTATEMRKVKHAYDRGINAIRGIEY
jgi:cob(I)alamin adenosyltransferase